MRRLYEKIIREDYMRRLYEKVPRKGYIRNGAFKTKNVTAIV